MSPYAVSFKVCLILSKSTWSYVACQTPVSANNDQQPGHISNGGGGQFVYTARSESDNTLPRGNRDFFRERSVGQNAHQMTGAKCPGGRFAPVSCTHAVACRKNLKHPLLYPAYPSPVSISNLFASSSHAHGLKSLCHFFRAQNWQRVRKYTKKSSRREYGNERLAAALEAVRAGIPL